MGEQEQAHIHVAARALRDIEGGEELVETCVFLLGQAMEATDHESARRRWRERLLLMQQILDAMPTEEQ